jgi:hypothetical protein
MEFRAGRQVAMASFNDRKNAVRAVTPILPRSGWLARLSFGKVE